MQLELEILCLSASLLCLKIPTIFLKAKLVVCTNFRQMKVRKYSGRRKCYQANNEPRQIDDMDDTVVFVPGIFRDESLWSNWKKAFEEVQQIQFNTIFRRDLKCLRQTYSGIRHQQNMTLPCWIMLKT